MLAGPEKPVSAQPPEDARDVDLALAERREVRDALAAALVLEVEVAEPRQGELDVLLGHGARVVDDVARVVVELHPVAADLVEDPAADLGGREQVRVGLDAEPDPGRLRLVRDRRDVLPEGLDLLGRLRVAGERVEHLDAELLAGARTFAEPLLALVGVELRVAAHRDAREAVLVQQPAAAVDVGIASGSRCSRNPLTAPISTFVKPAAASPRSASSSVYGRKMIDDPV